MTDSPDAYSKNSREWWAQRWIDLLESFGWIRRLARARNYARQGNVLNIDFKGPKVSARVQGTAPDAYKVSLSLDAFSDEEWDYITDTLSQQAFFSAKLLSGEMPHNIEEAFTANGLSLFPLTRFDIHSRCSCPDKANPCKHIGAVYYLLGDRFSEDPFVLFQLRGRTQEEIVAKLREKRNANGKAMAAEVAVVDTNGASSSLPAPRPSLSTDVDLDRLWHYNQPLEPSLVVIAPPPSSETVLDVLGPIPLAASTSAPSAEGASSSKLAMDYLDTVYKTVSQQAVIAGLGQM